MDQIPAFPPSYYEETRAPQILAGNIILQIISTVFLCARFYSRAILLRSFRTDDIVLVLAWAVATIPTSTAYVQVYYGAGHHTFAIAEDRALKLSFAGFIAQLSFILALPLTKLSICLSYRRVFHSERVSRIILGTIVVLLILTGTSLEFVSIFQCRPIHAFWTSFNAQHSSCIDIRPAFYVNGVSNLLTDVALIVIVVPPILKLHMASRQRIALLAVICLGWLAVIAGIIRMARTARVLNGTDDPAWDSYDISIWTAVEVHVSLFCAAAPCVKPIVVKIMPRLLGPSYTPSISLRETDFGTQGEKGSAHLGSTQMDTMKSQAAPEARTGHSWMVMGADDESLPDNQRTASNDGIIMKTEEVIVRSQTKI